MIRRSFLVLACTVGVALGCGGSRQYWHAQPVSTPAVRVMPRKVSTWGKLLYVETELYNATSVPIMVDRDQVTLVLPSGATIGRSQGTFTQHKGYVVPPGGMHAVHVDFKADGFKWSEVQLAHVNFGAAVTLDGQPIGLPMMPVSPNALPPQPITSPDAAPAAPAAPAGNGVKVEGSVEVKM